MEIKLCVYCEHCYHKEGRYWSTLTGYESGYFQCKCEHFSMESEDITDGWALKATVCPDYELSNKVKEELEKFKEGLKND